MQHNGLLPRLPMGSFLVLIAAAPALANAQGTLLVANQKDHTISIIDAAAGQQVAAVPENATTGHEVTASPDGRTAYVPIYGNSGVGRPGTDGSELLAIDVASRKIIGKLDFGHGVRPHCPVYDTKRGVLYVTTELDKTVSIIDPKNLKIVGAIPTEQSESHMLAISHDGKKGYTANVGPGTVSVIDLENRKHLATIPISGTTQRISISPDDRMVFTADQTKPQLAVIDTATNKVKTWVKLADKGYGTASTIDGRYLLVAVPGPKHVAVVDLHKLEVVRTIDVPGNPQEVLMRPDGKVAYVSCNVSGKIAAIDLSNWNVQLISAGNGADGLGWSNLSAKEEVSSR
jgi:YVTN family beta-propeller protein